MTTIPDGVQHAIILSFLGAAALYTGYLTVQEIAEGVRRIRGEEPKRISGLTHTQRTQGTSHSLR